MNIIALVQARTGSSRLPGKVLAPLAGRPMIEHVLRRTAQSAVQETVLVTSDTAPDDALAAAVGDMGFPVRRGNLHDVLDRYHQAAVASRADVVVRITGDCPLIDPEVIDRCIAAFRQGAFDYVSNAYPSPSFPDGLDVEVFSCDALEQAWREGKKPSEREHVTPYIWNRPRLFRLGSVACAEDLSSLRLTVDEEADLLFMRKVFAAINSETARLQDILDLLRHRPQLCSVNAGILRNEGYLKSLCEDAAAKGGQP